MESVAWHLWHWSEKSLIKCKSYSFELATSDPTSGVKQARLLIEGLLAPVEQIELCDVAHDVTIDMGASGPLPNYCKAFSIICWDTCMKELSISSGWLSTWIPMSQYIVA